jgi:NADH-quinone oxidoreductase subunit H
LAVTSLGVFGIMMAGWASNNKFSLMGGLRSSAQMISYELSMGLAIVGVLMVSGTMRVEDIVEGQGNPLRFFGASLPVPGWGVFLQPIGFLIFLVASFAETNRSPFDLAEGESELVAGYHLEYSSMKFALFFMAEYSNMVVAAFLISTLYFGGYQVPYANTETLTRNPHGVLAVLCLGLMILGSLAGALMLKRGDSQKSLYAGIKKWEPAFLAFLGFLAAAGAAGVLIFFFSYPFPEWIPPVLTALLQALCLLTKVIFFCWLFVWVRWSMPRFRYDQLMKMGWKLMLPLALLNLLLTGAFILAQK